MVAVAGVAGDADDVLLRLGRRRRLEDHQRRHHLDSDFRRPADRLHRRHRGRAVQSRTSSMSGTGETDIRSQIGFGDGVYKSTDAGKTWTQHRPARHARRSARSWSTRADPDRRLCRGARPSYTARTPSAASSAPPTAGAPGTRFCSRRPKPARWTSRWDPANPRVDLRRPCGTRIVRRGASTPRSKAPAAGSGRPPTAATTGPRSPATDCPPAMWRRSGVAVAAGGQSRLPAARRAERRRPLPLRRRRRQLDARRRRSADHQPRLVFRQHHGRPEKSRPRLRAQRGAVPLDRWRRLVHRPQRRARRRRLPHALDRPGRAAAHDARLRPGHECQRRRRRDLEHLVQPADRADVPRHHRQSLSVHGLRRAAGQRHGGRPQPHQPRR